MTNRYLYLIIAFGLLVAFKSKGQNLIKGNPTGAAQTTDCIISKLPKTVNYKSYLDKIKNCANDTLAVLENITIAAKTYKTCIEKKEDVIKIWVDVSTKSGKKRVMIGQEYLGEASVIITTLFDLKKCKITRTTETLNYETETTAVKTENVEL